MCPSTICLRIVTACLLAKRSSAYRVTTVESYIAMAKIYSASLLLALTATSLVGCASSVQSEQSTSITIEKHTSETTTKDGVSFADKDSATDKTVQEYLQAIDRYKVLAGSKSSHDLFQEIEKSKEVIRIKNANKPSTFLDLTDADVQMSTAFLMVLDERSKRNESDASFYYGLHLIQLCMVLGQQGTAGSTEGSVCDDAMKRMKVAASSNDPRAMRAIGMMYKDGLGVQKSKYVAADWLYKSARQYNDEKTRESALSALEDAIILVPDHPGALKLRKSLLAE